MKGYCCENDKLYDVICQTPELLCVIARFGIGCGFGDRTIRQICQEKALDCNTVLAVLNFHTKAVRFYDPEVNISIECLLGYLQNSHKYYLDYLFPTIRKKLIEAVGSLTDNELAFMILKFFDEYALYVKRHMEKEEKEVFPYIDALLKGKQVKPVAIDMSLLHRSPIEKKLSELRELIIKFYDINADGMLLNSLLYDIFMLEEDLTCHCKMETTLFVEQVKRIEASGGRKFNQALSEERDSTLSEREKEIVGCIAMGMSNKETADRLCISTNTVATHRKNIAKKINIHSSAALVLYAIMNNIITTEQVRSAKKQDK